MRSVVFASVAALGAAAFQPEDEDLNVNFLRLLSTNASGNATTVAATTVVDANATTAPATTVPATTVVDPNATTVPVTTAPATTVLDPNATTVAVTTGLATTAPATTVLDPNATTVPVTTGLATTGGATTGAATDKDATTGAKSGEGETTAAKTGDDKDATTVAHHDHDDHQHQATMGPLAAKVCDAQSWRALGYTPPAKINADPSGASLPIMLDCPGGEQDPDKCTSTDKCYNTWGDSGKVSADACTASAKKLYTCTEADLKAYLALKTVAIPHKKYSLDMCCLASPADAEVHPTTDGHFMKEIFNVATAKTGLTWEASIFSDKECTTKFTADPKLKFYPLGEGGWNLKKDPTTKPMETCFGASVGFHAQGMIPKFSYCNKTGTLSATSHASYIEEMYFDKACKWPLQAGLGKLQYCLALPDQLVTRKLAEGNNTGASGSVYLRTDCTGTGAEVKEVVVKTQSKMSLGGISSTTTCLVVQEMLKVVAKSFTDAVQAAATKGTTTLDSAALVSGAKKDCPPVTTMRRLEESRGLRARRRLAAHMSDAAISVSTKMPPTEAKTVYDNLKAAETGGGALSKTTLQATVTTAITLAAQTNTALAGANFTVTVTSVSNAQPVPVPVVVEDPTGTPGTSGAMASSILGFGFSLAAIFALLF